MFHNRAPTLVKEREAGSGETDRLSSVGRHERAALPKNGENVPLHIQTLSQLESLFRAEGFVKMKRFAWRHGKRVDGRY
jgi:hypothetical protein